MEDPALTPSSDDADDPSPQIQQHLEGDEIQAIGEMKGSTAFGKIIGNVIIYNYYGREELQIATIDTAASAEADLLPCPYRDLYHFEPEDAEYFFGRKSFVDALVEATQTGTFIPLLGASGSGKSSVVWAGLVPKLIKAGHWQFTHFRPGTDPFYALAEALVPLYRSELDSTDVMTQAEKLAESLKGGRPLSRVFSLIQRKHPNDRVLLIADQFEELYTLCTDEITRRKFLDLLLAGIAAPADRIPCDPLLVATMRADFLGNALSYRSFADVLQNADLKLGPMNRAELTEAIEKPAQKLGVTFEAGLVERILGDVEAEPGILPLLEFALTELWQRRSGKQLTHAAYEAIGEVQGALGRHANQEYAKFKDEADRERVRRIFIQLVRPGEGAEDTRRIATKAELGEQNWSLVKQLADARLVVTSRNGADRETVEVVHEALIRNWGELRGWMEIDRVFRAWQERLRVMMGQWEKMQQDKGALLRGLPLMEAESWLQQRVDEISLSEQIFIETSIAQQAREQKEQTKRRQVTIFGLASGLVIVSILAIGIGFQWQKTQITNLIANSETLFSSNKRVEALIESIKAGKQSKWAIRAEPDIRMQVVFALQQAVYGDKLKNRLSGNLARFSPNNKILATVATLNNSGINIWNLNGQKIRTIGNNKLNNNNYEHITSIDISPDSNILVSCSEEAGVRLWSLDGTLIRVIKKVGETPYSVKFSHDGKIVAAFFTSGIVKFWHPNGMLISTFKQELNFRGGESDISMSFSYDNKTIATANGNTIKLWNLDGTFVKTLKGSSGSETYEDVAFSSVGKIIAALSIGQIDLWSTDGRYIKTLDTGIHGSCLKCFNSLSFSPDSKSIAVGVGDSKLRLWNLEKGDYISLEEGGNTINSVAFSPDGKFIASSDHNGTTILWNLIGREPMNLKGKIKYVGDMNFSSDSKTIIVAESTQGSLEFDKNYTVDIWNLDNKQAKNIPFKSNHQPLAKSFSPDGKMIAIARFNENTSLFKIDGTLLASISEISQNLTFSPDNKILLSTPYGNTKLNFWNLDGSLVKTISDPLNDPIFSPDGKTLASIDTIGNIKLLDLEGKQFKTFVGCISPVFHSTLNFSPDGTIVAASCERDNTAKLWDLGGKLLVTLNGHNNTIERLKFSTDGKTIATLSNEAVKLWNLEGKELKSFKYEIKSFENEKSPNYIAITNVGFSPNNKVLAFGYSNGMVSLRSLDMDELLIQGCDLLHDYLKSNPDVDEKDRHLCDEI
jgi:WD40 repeat protein